MLKALRHLHIAAAVLAGPAGCTPGPPETATAPRDTVRIVDTVRVASQADPAVEQRLAALQLQVLERDAQIDELSQKLDEAIREVVRSMARQQTLATRAEAASAMAEAEVTVDQLKRVAGGEPTPEVSQAQRLLEMSSGEFNKQNYGGSLYLANQAKSTASTGRGRLAESGTASLRPGEVRFAAPLRLMVTSRSNVREGPGTAFRSLFMLERNARIVGHSHLDQWVRITDDQRRTGWIFYSLVQSVR